MKLTRQQAIKRLQAAIDEAGSGKAYADQVGVSGVLISDMKNGRRHISGKVAAHLGLKRIIAPTVTYLEEA